MTAVASRRIALRGTDGEARAWVLVDAADYDDLTRCRWNLSSTGYAYRLKYTGDGSRERHHLPMHRYLLGLERGDPREADHINRDKLDNRRVNLRVVESRASQLQNQGSRANCTSRLRGVSWDKRHRKWRATVQLNYKQVHLGRFDSETAAGIAASKFRREHMPFSEDAA